MLHDAHIHFNSIKVRLEQILNRCLIRFGEFQFHKGAIRTGSLSASAAHRPQFQFHKGATRTMPQEISDKFAAHFNSIKVRLELIDDTVLYFMLFISIP